MNVDAQEAVLGLLSMGSAHTHVHFHQDEQQNRHHHHHHHHLPNNTSSPTTTSSSSSSRITPAVTSSATLNSILTTTTSPHIPSSSSPRFDSVFPTAPTPTIPAKRKQRDVVGFFEEQGPGQRAFHPPTQYPFENGHPSVPFRPYELPRSALAPPAPSEAIDCMCGSTIDNGFSVACDRCSRWCHGVCFGLTNSDETRNINFWCWRCEPRSAAEIEFARRAMGEKLAAIGGPVAVAGVDGEEEVVSGKRRKASPGTERKRRASAAVPGEKRKRRLSVVQLPTPVVPAPNGGTTDEEHVDIDEPWTQSYVHIAQDIVPSDETRTKLRRHAQHWRGITAVTPTPAPIAVTELPPLTIHNPLLLSSSNPYVLPPAYGVHATQPIASDHLITRYLSRITPSTSYLADPLNSYAHLGMPKPFVHLMGPPLGVALDARQVGNEGRFVRSGCRPNAVLRPVLCERKGEETLGFGVFALRDLKVGEEVVLGWEWDDGNAVHTLPALLNTPHMFPAPSSPPPEVTHLRNQMANILHALSSTFTSCACGARARDCALTQMAAFVDGQEHFNHLSQQHEESNHAYTTSGRIRKGKDLDLGPLVGNTRGFRTKERVPMSGGLGGMEMDGDEVVSVVSQKPSAKGKERAVEGDVGMLVDGEEVERSKEMKRPRNASKSPVNNTYIPPSPASPPHPTRSLPASRTELSSELRPPDPTISENDKDDSLPPKLGEDRMPPKMRKRWMHREVEAMKEAVASDREVVVVMELEEHPSMVGLGIRLEKGSEGLDRLDEQHLMPPPPSVPTSAPSSTASNAFAVPSTSPLTRFADLSLRSPAITSLVSNSSAIPHLPPRDNASPTPETVRVKANVEPSSVSPSAAERWSPLRRTLATKDVSPTPSSEPEPARMEMDDQTTPASPVAVDALDEAPPPPTMDSDDMSMVTSSSFVEPPPIVSDPSSSLDVPTERPPTPVSIPSTPSSPLPTIEVVLAECPPASALFDDELPRDSTDVDVPMSAEDEEVLEPTPSPSPPSETENRESAPSSPILPPVEPQSLAVSPQTLVPQPPSSPPSPASPVVEQVIPEPAVTPTPSITVEAEPEPETHAEAEAEAEPPAPAPQKVKLSLQAWKMKKQAEKEEQQRAGHAQAQAGGRGVEVGNGNGNVNVNGGASAQASPMSVNSALGAGDDEQGAVMEVEDMLQSSKADGVEMVRPLPATTPATTATTTTATIATPIAKLELNGYHGPPLLLPQTRVAKQEIIERPLSGLSGLKHLISAPSTLSNAKTAPVLERSVSPMGPDLAFNSSHSHSPLEGYVPLPPTKLSSNSSIRRLPQEDGEIRDISPIVTNSNSKPVSVPPHAPPPVISTEPTTPAVLPPRPNLLHAHPMARLPPRPSVALPPPLTGRGTPPGQGRRWASPVVPSSHAISPSVSMFSPSLARHKPPTAPRSMNVATGPLTPPLSNLNPNGVAPKPVHKSPPKGPRALMESWPGPRNSGGSSTLTPTTTTTSAAANVSMSTSPSAPPTSSLPIPSSMFPLPSLSTTTQYIPRGPSATRDLERWPNTTKELDRLMETRERERERERERDRDRGRDRDRDERERYGNRDRERDRDRDYDQRHYRGMRRPGWR